MTYVVYAIESKCGRIYVGLTANLENRIAQHNEGKVVSTRNDRPWLLLKHQEFPTREAARLFEWQLKKRGVNVLNGLKPDRATRRREGFERRTKKDFAHLLDLCKCLSGVVRSVLYLAEDRHYVKPFTAEELRSRYSKLCASIGALPSKLSTS